jgi:hypothetical protein
MFYSVILAKAGIQIYADVMIYSRACPVGRSGASPVVRDRLYPSGQLPAKPSQGIARRITGSGGSYPPFPIEPLLVDV